MRQHRPLKQIFENHKVKIKRGSVPIATICEDLEEMFESGLRHNELVIMPHPEKKGKFLILKGISASGEVLSSTHYMGPANALDPVTGDIFGFLLKPNNEISLRHIGEYSDTFKDVLPKMRKLIAEFKANPK